MKIIDLVQNDKGVYVPKNELNKSKNVVNKVDKSENLGKAFLDGVEIGICFFEKLNKQLERMRKLYY